VFLVAAKPLPQFFAFQIDPRVCKDFIT
jgi:hypothetical protein